MIKKGSFGFDVMSLMLPMYMKEKDREPVIRKYANIGSSYIRFLVYYVGKQDWKYLDKWSAPWFVKNNRVDFSKIRPQFKEDLREVLKLLKKYNQIPIVSVFDGCHWTEHASPFSINRNINSIGQLYNVNNMYIYEPVFDAVVEALKDTGITDFVIEIGNEPWFSNSPQNIAKWHRKAIEYLYNKHNIKPYQIQVNVTEKIGDPSINEWFQAELLCDERNNPCTEFTAKNTGENGIIFSYHGVGFPKHIEEGGRAYRPFVNSYVSTYFQTNNNFSSDGQTVDKNDPANKYRPCANEPQFQNMYCSPNKEELRKFYDYLLTKAHQHGLHFYTYSDLAKEVQKAKIVDGNYEYYQNWNLLDLDRVSVLAEVYKKHFGVYPENYGKFPDPQPPNPEYEEDEVLYDYCKDGGGNMVWLRKVLNWLFGKNSLYQKNPQMLFWITFLMWLLTIILYLF